MSTLDFALLKTENERIQAELQRRHIFLQTVDRSGVVSLSDLPNNPYETESVESDEIKNQYQNLSLDYCARELVLLLNLSDLLETLHRLQVVGLSLQRKEIEKKEIGIDGKAKKLFYLAAVNEADKTKSFLSEILETIELNRSLIEKYGPKFSDEESDIRKYCRDIVGEIHSDIDPSVFHDIQDNIFAKICDCCNRLAEVGLQKIDVELGYLLGNKASFSVDELQSKGKVFSGIMNETKLYLRKSISYMRGMQIMHNPPSLLQARSQLN